MAPPPFSGEIICSREGVAKPASDFYLKPNGKLRFSWCKACQYEITTKWRKDNRERYNVYMRRGAKKRRYGLTLDEYDARFAAVGFKCEVCGRKGRPDRYQDLVEGEVQLHLDHDHETTELRGILCTNCNNGIGRFTDDSVLLRAAADYIDRYRPRVL